MNQQISSRSLDAMTTAAVVAYYSQKKEAVISYAGHPPVLYKQLTDTVWSFARPPVRNKEGNGSPQNIPLAVDMDTKYTQLIIPMGSGGRFFVYTDGIIDAPDFNSKRFGFERLKNILDENANASLSEIKSAVLSALNQHAGKDLIHDDVTLIALEII